MASDDRDPVTGAYIFLDTGAPDTGVDPTLVSAQANDVGTRIIRANLAALEDYDYKREGLGGYAEDTNLDYVHNGTGWVQTGDSGWVTITALSTGWTAVGGETPQVRRVGSRVDIRGRVLLGAGSIGNILTVPNAPAVACDIGTTVNLNGGFVGTMRVTSAGILHIPTTAGVGSYIGSASSGMQVKLNGSWYLD